MYCSSGVAYITKRYFTNKYIILLCLWICSTTIPQIEIYEDDSAADVLETIFEECDQQRFVFVLDEWDFIFHKDFVTEENKKQYVLFLSNLLKDRSYVQLTYMTGILPIAKYSSGSELNMFWEYTMASEAKYNEYFGFTDSEVDQLYEKYTRNIVVQLSRQKSKTSAGRFRVSRDWLVNGNNITVTEVKYES